ncbi:MAG: hypothetical protein JWQ63_3838 [Mucilaginibacter sp.]|jgi:abequosyltransferase|nr:hypothetical protein [Mucilaginibacter sp.]
MINIYLSICIPTNGRLNILKNTLDSIYSDCKVNYDEFEVILSDNSTDDLLLEMLSSYKQYPNIVYIKSTSEGFLNSINALRTAKGLFLKLHNNYTMLNKGALTKMISFIKEEMALKPLIFFSNKELKRNNVKRYNSFDMFAYDLSFWNTWSTGFAIWKEDFDKYSTMQVNKMFPHTSLLLFQHGKSSFVINDVSLFNNQDIPKKGGYNLFETFAVEYLKMVENCLENKQIISKTFQHIKYDLFKNFLVMWYYYTKIAKNEYTYDLSGIKSSIGVFYPKTHYYGMILLAYKLAFMKIVKKTIKSLLMIKN